MTHWVRRLSYLLRQSRHDAELREEIEAHRALRAADLDREGLPTQQADAASRRALGSALLAREEAREVWLGSWDSWWQDAAYGLRLLRRSPAFTAAAIVTLALGIGVNTGIFTVVNAVLFREPSAPRAHELVSISQVVQGVAHLAGQDTFSTSDYVAYRERAQTLSGIVAYGNARGEATLGADTPRRVLGALVSCNLFDVLQQPPALGRALARHDCEPGADLVIVLSHELWQSAFGADPDVVGRTVQLNRQPVTIAGVATKGTFTGASLLQGGYLAPLSAGRRLASADSRYDDEGAAWLRMLGRRRDGIVLEQVRAELRVIAAQIDQQQPGRSTTVIVERARANDGLGTDLRGAATGAAAVLLAAFGLILVIACANVANLLLARGTARNQEIGVRMSLGASRARVVRQLVTESLLLALMGGLLGSALAVWSFQALVTLALPALLPPWFPLVLGIDVSPDLRVLLVALAVTAGTGILFGLAPALHVSTPDLQAVLKQDAGTAGRGRRGGRLRGALAGVQVALCMVLMMAAGLLLRGLHATYSVDPGFAYRDVALISLESAFDGYGEEEAATRRRRLVEGIAALPGVRAVASADHKPLGDDRSPVAIRLPGEDVSQRLGEMTTATEDYFSVLGLPLVRGRTFTRQEVSDRRPGPRPAILSATTAWNLWQDGDPIGRTLLSAPADHAVATETLQVVGVVADAQVTGLGRIDPYHVYVPGDGAALLIKSRADLRETVSDVRAAVHAVDPTLLVTVLPLEAALGWSRGISGVVTTLFGGLGALALLLASVGIYGVVSYAVAARQREIGIRLALGATAANVLALILRQTLRPVVVGAMIGAGAALAVSRILSSVLFGVSPIDPVGLAGAALVVLGVSGWAAAMAVRPVTKADLTAILRLQ